MWNRSKDTRELETVVESKPTKEKIALDLGIGQNGFFLAPHGLVCPLALGNDQKKTVPCPLVGTLCASGEAPVLKGSKGSNNHRECRGLLRPSHLAMRHDLCGEVVLSRVATVTRCRYNTVRFDFTRNKAHPHECTFARVDSATNTAS